MPPVTSAPVTSAPRAPAIPANPVRKPRPPPDWTAVVTALDRARGAALVGRDAAALGRVYLPGTAGMTADVSTIELLRARGWRLADAHHVIDRVSLLAPNRAAAAPAVTPAGPTAIRLEVIDRLPAHQVTDAAGVAVGHTPGRGAARRVLVLTRTAAGYRIAAMESS